MSAPVTDILPRLQTLIRMVERGETGMANQMYMAMLVPNSTMVTTAFLTEAANEIQRLRKMDEAANEHIGGLRKALDEKEERRFTEGRAAAHRDMASTILRTLGIEFNPEKSWEALANDAGNAVRKMQRRIAELEGRPDPAKAEKP